MTDAALPSIRTRLSRSIVAMSLVWGALMASVLAVVLHEGVDHLLDGGLQESAEILYGVMQDQVTLPHQEGGSLPAPPHEEGLVWQRLDGAGQVKLRSHEAPATALSARMNTGFSDSDSQWRVYTLPLPAGQGVLQVAQRAPARLQAHALILGLSLAVSLPMGVCVAWWLNRRLRQELQPLQDLSAQVVRHDPLDARTSLPAANRAELVPVVRAIDDLGSRLAERVANERAFSAHAAHALRTPLAGLSAQLAALSREVPVGLQPRVGRMREASARLSRVVTALISLFRAGGEMHWQTLSLPDMVARLPVQGVELRCEGLSEVQADPDLLLAALLNLVDNAVRHQATCVRVIAQREGADWRVRVLDDGTGMPEARRTALQEALQAQRYDEALGLGLGLTLADLVMRAHGGQVGLNPAQGRGLEVRLQWPARPADTMAA